MTNISGGIYPTMITPYKNCEIDYDMVKRTEVYCETDV